MSYSQTISEIIKPTEIDTASLVSSNEITLLNHAYQDLKDNSRIADSLFNEIINHVILENTLQAKNENYKKEVENLGDQIIEKNILINSYKSGENKLRRKLKIAKITNKILAFLAIGELGYIAVQEIKSN